MKIWAEGMCVLAPYVMAPSETAKLVDIGILDLNMFRKFLKNSNSMFDVALSM